MALARGVSQAWDERGGELIEKAAWAEMTALKVIWEAIALQQVAQLGQTIGGALSKACFVAGTEVWTAEGLVPIERVRAGQLVLSRDEATGELGWKVVVRTFVTPGQEVVALRLADAERGEHEDVEATAEHPFWLEGRGWVGAGELVPGQRVLRADGRWLRVEGVEVREGAHTVYNLEVEDFHTYVVGNLGAWVHNECRVGWLGKVSNKIGKEAEARLKDLLGPGAKKETFSTPLGKRKADSVLDGIIHESKAGYVTMSTRIREQIAKDTWLKATRRVEDVEWHFFKSSKSEGIGPSVPLREALENAGFKVHEHL